MSTHLSSRDCFTRFKSSIHDIELPQRFTFPFFYTPHPLCVIAAKELQEHLQTQSDWTHDFGIDHHVDGINVGKMFGVLLVQRADGEIGYLSAFSGRLADASHWPRFVPPVADTLREDSFFRKGEKEIESMTLAIHDFENHPDYLQAKHELDAATKSFEKEVFEKKTTLKKAKAIRKVKRSEGRQNLKSEALLVLEEQLNNESIHDHFSYKDMMRKWKMQLSITQRKVNTLDEHLERLKKERKERSVTLQQELFDAYQFLNSHAEIKTLVDIFEQTTVKTPPSGAGECAAPKLLQYAFKHDMKPLAMAEFWWGQSPKSEIRKHGNFYPSCKGKCEPILGHMLKGMAIDKDPLLGDSTEKHQIEVLFEDEAIAVVYKPEGMLSVPSKINNNSLMKWAIEKYPQATGPVMVHRLDRMTSGLMLLAKSKEAHKNLQDQFLTKTIKKRYVAWLEGLLKENKGSIDLPLRVDLDDRPRQLVCYEHGKAAKTYWEVIKRTSTRTKVYFYPVTGRTHQLRVHAAHHDGLNTPIVGDSLYGLSDRRLYLHAEKLEFLHPETNQKVTFYRSADF